MLDEGIGLGEGMSTAVADVGFESRMRGQVRLQASLATESAGTHAAGKGFNTRMPDEMLPQVASVVEGLAAFGAEIWRFPTVDAHVILEGARLLESLAADRTDMRLEAFVLVDMINEETSQGEFLQADIALMGFAFLMAFGMASEEVHFGKFLRAVLTLELNLLHLLFVRLHVRGQGFLLLENPFALDALEILGFLFDNCCGFADEIGVDYLVSQKIAFRGKSGAALGALEGLSIGIVDVHVTEESIGFVKNFPAYLANVLPLGVFPLPLFTLDGNKIWWGVICFLLLIFHGILEILGLFRNFVFDLLLDFLIFLRFLHFNHFLWLSSIHFSLLQILLYLLNCLMRSLRNFLLVHKHPHILIRLYAQKTEFKGR